MTAQTARTRSAPAGIGFSFSRRYPIPYICLAGAMHRLHSMMLAGAKALAKSRAAVRRTHHSFPGAASPRNKALVDDRLSLRSAALAIVGLSLFGWIMLSFLVSRSFGNP